MAFETYLSFSSMGKITDSKAKVPRYLFRAFSNESRGINSSTVIASEASKLECAHPSIYEIPFKEAKPMVEKHLLWYRYYITSEFISWSSSLLWVLQHAVRKVKYEKEDDICICVLDNTRRVEGVSIYPAMTLLDVYGIESIGKLTHEYYRAEYLAHCEIENTSNFRVVPLQALIDHGLYELFPELDEQEDPSQLARQVNEFRSQFFSRSSNVTIREAQLSRNLGELFGSNLALPVAVAFLSLQPRPESGDGFDIILEGLDDLEIPLPNNPDALAYRDPDVNTRNLEEVSTFMRLLRLLCATGWSGSEDGELSSRSSGSDDEDGLIREMNSLSLRGSKTVYDGENDEGNAYFEGIHGDADDSDDEAEENNW